MFEQTFKNIDDVLWKEAGCTTELDYTEQTSWLLFLKYLDDLEHEKALEAELAGKSYTFILEEQHRWSVWAAPKKANGTADHDKALVGNNLIDYVSRQLLPYLQEFKQRASASDEYVYGQGEEEPCLRDCDHEHDFAWHRCAQHHSHQHVDREFTGELTADTTQQATENAKEVEAA